MFWDSGVSFGCLTTWLMWALAFGLIALSLAGMHDNVALLGLGISAAAASLTIIRDNQRTRRMVRTMRGLDDDVRKLR
jgi:hypothetical protein